MNHLIFKKCIFIISMINFNIIWNWVLEIIILMNSWTNACIYMYTKPRSQCTYYWYTYYESITNIIINKIILFSENLSCLISFLFSCWSLPKVTLINNQSWIVWKLSDMREIQKPWLKSFFIQNQLRISVFPVQMPFLSWF